MELDEMNNMKIEPDDNLREKEMTLGDKIVQLVLDDDPEISLDDFQENDKKILSVLNQDNEVRDNKYTFNGLARKLGMHQQSLSRSLRRLESSGLVEKSKTGYKQSRSLRSVLVRKSRLDLEEMSQKISRHRGDFVQLLQLYMPETIDIKELVNYLVGKWFGNLLWVGLTEGEGGYVLQWTGGIFQVNLKIVSRYAIVESNAVGDKEKANAVIGAYRIFEQITKILQKTKPIPGTRVDTFNQYN